MAFGDNINDALLIEGCGVGLFMGNGKSELKRIGDYRITDYIAADIDKDGITNVRQHF